MKEPKENSSNKNAATTPFEWITDCQSVLPLVESALTSLKETSTVPSARVLHVGSGSSVLGETIAETFPQQIDEVVNCDVDGPTLQAMDQRWQSSSSNNANTEKVRFVQTDFSKNDNLLPYEPGYFHLAVDKGTLDCTLCSDATTAGMLSEIYRLLDPNGSIYLLISFHHVDLLRPLLEDIPGVQWEVSHQVIQRKVEDLVGNGKTNSICAPQQQCKIDQDKIVELMESKGSGPWAKGSFEPDEYYRRFANVFICRRRGQEESTLDKHVLAEHVQKVNDDWFQLQNPMLTDSRKQEILTLFQEHHSDNNNDTKNTLYDLELAYKIIFTDEERAHFTYDLFLEDWEAWIGEKTNASLPKDKMTVQTALDFLKAMQ